ncbi:Riboflavin biosynthesis protein RibBA [compost metagenome]
MCHTGDIFRSLKCDCGDELENALNFISKHRGIFIYTPEEGRDIGVLNKISVYKSQSEGLDTVEAQYANRHPNELRTYDYIKDILEHFSVSSIKLISNNPEKRLHVELAGIVVADVIKLPSKVNPHNEHYLKTKMVKNGHDFKLEFSD